ncbi:MAG TPA: hypothetical protein VGB23_01855 [Nitrospirota bacterium]
MKLSVAPDSPASMAICTTSENAKNEDQYLPGWYRSPLFSLLAA